MTPGSASAAPLADHACPGLDPALSVALGSWRKPMAIHDPAKVIVDLAVALALGGDRLGEIAVPRAEPAVFGRVASDPTVSRTIERARRGRGCGGPRASTRPITARTPIGRCSSMTTPPSSPRAARKRRRRRRSNAGWGSIRSGPSQTIAARHRLGAGGAASGNAGSNTAADHKRPGCDAREQRVDRVASTLRCPYPPMIFPAGEECRRGSPARMTAPVATRHPLW
jgi:hypothetical protein